MKLEGGLITLIPLAAAQLDALCAVGFDSGIWRFMPRGVRNHAEMQLWIDAALNAQNAGTALPFATTLSETGEVIGSTRFLNMDLPNLRAEIGATWIAPAWQRTRVNTEAKYLMLRYAFEERHWRRVEFKTGSKNVKSRAAILRIGATEEGIFRKHMVQEDDSARDSVYFSIIDDEWPAVKARLESMLARSNTR